MYMIAEVSQYVAVASFSEAWIEIHKSESSFERCRKSPPSRRRGLKYLLTSLNSYKLHVASFSEAWIEIIITLLTHILIQVASFSEAWIEILVSS